MSRLTEREPYWENEEYWLDTEPDGDKVDRVYLKLRDYENTELEPVEVEQLKHELEVYKRALQLTIKDFDDTVLEQKEYQQFILDKARKELEDEKI